MKVENVGVKGRGKGGGGTKMFRARMYRWEYFFWTGGFVIVYKLFFCYYVEGCRI